MKCANCHAQWEPPKNQIAPITKCPFCGAAIDLPEQVKLDSFKAVIASIASRFGVDLLLDRNKAMAYFVDLAPTLKKERQMFQYLLLCDGNIQIIQSLSSSLDEQLACRHKISARMIEDFFIGKEIADQICDDFWHAIGGDAGSDDQFAADYERAGNLNHVDSSESDKKEAFAIYEKLANKGYLPAQVELSSCYRFGDGCDEDPLLAKEWLEKALQAGDIRAMYVKADMFEEEYTYGGKNESALKSAFEWYQKAAEAGYGPAQDALGNIYSTGKASHYGPDFHAVLSLPDWSKAFIWYSKAAVGEHVKALHHLGQCYEYGKGTKQDWAKAFDCYLRSAGSPEEIEGKFHVDSVAKVALCYECGLGVPQNCDLAFQWHRKALHWATFYEEMPEYHPFLLYYLAFCYLRGIYVSKDLELAAKHMRTASNYDVKEASEWIQDYDTKSQMLNVAIADIENGQDRDIQARAFSHILQLAETDFLPAQTCLGVCFKKGDGCEKDMQKAFEWYSKAADNGSSRAQFLLSIFYKNGDFVPQDYAKELQLLQASAEKGFVSAETRLGFLFCYGERGARKDEKEAVKWLERAANHGDYLAQAILADCKRYGFGTEVDLPAAAQLYQHAADQGYAVAMYELGNCYNEGIGVNQDFTQAVNWFTKAAEAGDKNAMYTLGKWYAEGVNLDADMEKARMYMTSASEKGVAGATQWLAANPVKDAKPKWAFWKKSKS